MDRRLLPGETREAAMQEIRDALDEFARRVEPLKYELFSQGEVAANVNTPEDHPFVVLANQALADVAGEERPLTGYVQTSDGRWFAGAGLPIIIFGPSDPAVAHAPDEHVSVEQLVEAARFLALLALRQLDREPYAKGGNLAMQQGQTAKLIVGDADITSRCRCINVPGSYMIFPRANRVEHHLPGFEGVLAQVLSTPQHGAKFVEHELLVEPNGHTTGHHCEEFEQFFFVLEGQVQFDLEGKAHKMVQGSFAWLPPNAAYAFHSEQRCAQPAGVDPPPLCQCRGDCCAGSDCCPRKRCARRPNRYLSWNST